MNRGLALALVMAGVLSQAEGLAREADPFQKEDRAGSARAIRDQLALQMMAGALFAPMGIGPPSPPFRYAPLNLRINWRVADPGVDDDSIARHLELVFELSGSLVYEGFGEILIGPTFLVRYNLFRAARLFGPYVQLGVGAVFNDAYKEKQRFIGLPVEFTPQASLGVHVSLTRSLSLDLEAMYHHISNAGLSQTRNLGTNAVGAQIGFTWHLEQTRR